jgi:hypothetical protein
VTDDEGQWWVCPKGRWWLQTAMGGAESCWKRIGRRDGSAEEAAWLLVEQAAWSGQQAAVAASAGTGWAPQVAGGRAQLTPDTAAPAAEIAQGCAASAAVAADGALAPSIGVAPTRALVLMEAVELRKPCSLREFIGTSSRRGSVPGTQDRVQVGRLLYLSQLRPDLQYAVGQLVPADARHFRVKADEIMLNRVIDEFGLARLLAVALVLLQPARAAAEDVCQVACIQPVWPWSGTAVVTLLLMVTFIGAAFTGAAIGAVTRGRGASARDIGVQTDEDLPASESPPTTRSDFATARGSNDNVRWVTSHGECTHRINCRQLYERGQLRRGLSRVRLCATCGG